MPRLATILLTAAAVLATHLCLLFWARSRGGRGGRDGRAKLIIDTDAGSDDALALLLALALPDHLDLLAITCTYGNANESSVERNVLKVLTSAARPEVAVYAGAAQPLLQSFTAGDYFGDDGLGDFDFGREVLGAVDASRHAAAAMVDLVNRYPGQVSVLALGPLTNVALAAKLHEGFARNVRRLHLMGSALGEAGSGRPEVEFNFGLDPEADAVVLGLALGLPSLVTPWDLARRSAISKEWRKEVLGRLDSERVRFLNGAEYAVLERVGVWHAADAMAVAALVWPELIGSSLEAHMSAATCGPHRGAVELDYENPPNVEVVREFDVEAFKRKLLRHLA